MGNYNSGRRGGRALADEALRVDLAWMIRTGLAVPGACGAGTLHWTRRGVACGAVRYEADMTGGDEGRLILSYAKGSGDAREEVRQIVRLVCTMPPFGGRRWWMICPLSGQRCAKLYLPQGGKRFGSRTVWGLAYHSQRDAHNQRPFERLFRLQKRLGSTRGYDAILKRPKGMWHRTYARHLDRYWQLDEACDQIWGGMAARILSMRDG